MAPSPNDAAASSSSEEEEGERDVEMTTTDEQEQEVLEVEEDDDDLVEDVEIDPVGTYKPGSIKRIKLTNFLTYGDVVVRPGPR